MFLNVYLGNYWCYLYQKYLKHWLIIFLFKKILNIVENVILVFIVKLLLLIFDLKYTLYIIISMVKKMKLKNVLVIVLILGIAAVIFEIVKGLNSTSNKQENKDEEVLKEDDTMKNDFVIYLEINGITYKATLIDNETTRELLSRLPFTIVMNELNKNEKYYYFDKELPSNASKVEKIHAGDLMLYKNDCLVLFYESFSTTYSYTKIGEIEDVTSLKETVGENNIQVTFRK